MLSTTLHCCLTDLHKNGFPQANRYHGENKFATRIRLFLWILFDVFFSDAHNLEPGVLVAVVECVVVVDRFCHH